MKVLSPLTTSLFLLATIPTQASAQSTTPNSTSEVYTTTPTPTRSVIWSHSAGPRVTTLPMCSFPPCEEPETTLPVDPLTSYITHLTDERRWSDMKDILSTAIEWSIFTSLTGQNRHLGGGLLPTATDALETATWYQVLPTQYQEYVASAASHEASLLARQSGAAVALGSGFIGRVLGAAGVVGMMLV